MLHIVNETLFERVEKPCEIEAFHKVQLRALKGAETDTNPRLCTLMYDGDTMSSHNVNIRSNMVGDNAAVLIRSSERNRYDAEVIIAAIPFCGVLINSPMRNYRVRNAFTVKITPEMEAAHPEELAGCEFILYAVFEPNTNALFNTTHPKYDARGIRIDVVEASIDEETSTPDVRNNRIFINIEDDAVVVNFDQVVYDLRGREVDYTKKGVVPYAIWTGPDNREGKPAPKRGGNKNAERTDNDSQRKYNNRSGNRGRNTYAPRSYNDDIKVSGDDFGGKRSYPAKSKKELNNRNNGKSNKGKKPYKK